LLNLLSLILFMSFTIYIYILGNQDPALSRFTMQGVNINYESIFPIFRISIMSIK